VPIGVLNEDWGLVSQQLISRFERASAFSEIRRYSSLKDVKAAVDRQDVMVVVSIGQDFSRKLAGGEPATVQLLLDGRKSNSAQIINGYVGAIVRQFSEDYRLGSTMTPASEIVDRTWYNPNREYRMAMVPSLVGTLAMSTVLMIVGMSVARERELGTFEQLLVSPLQAFEIIIGKAVPGLLVGLGQGAFITLIVTQVFGIALTGSIFVLFAGLSLFLLAVIGVGLSISSLASNQQQAMMGIMVFMMPAMMLSGFASPVQNMPTWLQPIALMNPLTHFLTQLVSRLDPMSRRRAAVVQDAAEHVGCGDECLLRQTRARQSHREFGSRLVGQQKPALAAPRRVINLMAALRQSIAAAKKPAVAAAARERARGPCPWLRP
jgi:ABC-2 type transport system permease protein